MQLMQSCGPEGRQHLQSPRRKVTLLQDRGDGRPLKSAGNGAPEYTACLEN